MEIWIASNTSDQARLGEAIDEKADSRFIHRTGASPPKKTCPMACFLLDKHSMVCYTVYNVGIALRELSACPKARKFEIPASVR